MSLGQTATRALRRAASELLAEEGEGYEHFKRLGDRLVPRMDDVRMMRPVRVGDYTDFYASVHHATNVGRLFRPDNPLLPNYKYVPIGYHGRASSIVVSGTPVRRPVGQVKPADANAPVVRPTRLLDYEAETGVYVGQGNPLGTPVPLRAAEEHLFGMCLLNDWSARDVQAWEYQPLGPFLAKSFATTVSPWVVTFEALAPFRVPLAPRAEGDPEPLAYLSDAGDKAQGGVDMTIEVWLRTRRMREAGKPAERLSRANASDLYWSVGQMLTHHTSNGCNMKSGNLLGSGTISGQDEGGRGCLLELTSRGANPVKLANGEERKFLEDGDEVTLRGYCERAGFARIGFGECSGEIISAVV
jgi:fumarylacetoacetase